MEYKSHKIKKGTIYTVGSFHLCIVNANVIIAIRSTFAGSIKITQNAYSLMQKHYLLYIVRSKKQNFDFYFTNGQHLKYSDSADSVRLV